MTAYEAAKRIRAAARGKEFLDLRHAFVAAGILAPASREVGWYRYTVNTGRRACRSPGLVAKRVRFLSESNLPAGSGARWCNAWPRTRASWNVELDGCVTYSYLCDEVLARMPLRRLAARVAALRRVLA